MSHTVASLLHLLTQPPSIYEHTASDIYDTYKIMCVEDEKSGLARRRSALRLLCELLLVGVHHNTLPLVATVRALAAADFERDPATAQASLSLLAGFAKWHRVEFLGLPRRPPADLPSDPPPEVLLTYDSLLVRIFIASLIKSYSSIQDAAEVVGLQERIGHNCLQYMHV